MENNEHKRIVEINGVKVEVDLRTAKRVDAFSVGDTVKLLLKDYSGYKSYPGVIVGFDEFSNRPTIIVAYLLENYSEFGIKFAYINKETVDSEICPAQDFEFQVSKNAAIDWFDKGIEKKKRDLEELVAHKVWFEKNYQRFFEKAFEPKQPRA